MLSEMGNVFEEAWFMAHRDVVHQYKMLMDLPHIADVRHDSNVIHAGQQTHSQKLTYATQARAVWLEKADASGLEVILEHDAVRNMFAYGERNRSYESSKSAMRIDVIGVRRFLDPPRIDARKLLAGDNRFWKRPLLVGIEHDHCVGSNQFTKELSAVPVSIERATDFELESVEALIEAPLYTLANSGIVIVIPADTGVVARISAGEHI